MAKRRKRNPKTSDILTVAALGAAAYGAVRVWPSIREALGNLGNDNGEGNGEGNGDGQQYPEGYLGPFDTPEAAEVWRASGHMGVCPDGWRLQQSGAHFYWYCVVAR